VGIGTPSTSRVAKSTQWLGMDSARTTQPRNAPSMEPSLRRDVRGIHKSQAAALRVPFLFPRPVLKLNVFAMATSSSSTSRPILPPAGEANRFS